jgi:hypothetical protein
MQGTTYNDYLTELIKQEKLWAAAKQTTDTNTISKIEDTMQYIFYNAYVDGADPYALWRDMFKGAYGKEPTETQMKNADRSLQEIFLIRQYVDTMNRLNSAPDYEKDNIEGELQALLLKDIGSGMDAYEMNYQALWIQYGTEPTAAQVAATKPRVDAAYQAYYAMQANQKSALVATRPTSDQKRPNITPFSYHDKWGETYSGADMVVFLAFPGYKPIEVGTASTVSYTTYREKKQVRTLGRISAKGITKGTRTISGRLIFTIISEHIVESLRKEIPYLRDIKTILMDELP